ncbi:MAG: HYR domain-containing protein, partial [Phaeodactylibacter sp.]|nr:HYR domain-containing protein [Phaeodactylibacter sp.]
MKKMYLSLIISVCLANLGYSQYTTPAVSVSARVGEVRSTEGSFFDPNSCYTLGTKHYTALVYFSVGVGGSEYRSDLLTCSSGGDCTYGNGTSTGELAARHLVNNRIEIQSAQLNDLFTYLEAWEDDDFEDPPFGLGDPNLRWQYNPLWDHCFEGRADNASVFDFRSTFPSADDVYNTSPTFPINIDTRHKWNIEYNWRYAYQPTQQSPLGMSCDYYESVGAVAGRINAWVLDLKAGDTYEFKATTGADPFLRIYGPDGHTIVAQNDGFTDNLPRILYTPTQSGIYFMEISESWREVLAQDATILYKVIPPATPTLTASATTVCKGTPITFNLSGTASSASVKKIQYCNAYTGCQSESDWQDLTTGDTYIWDSNVSTDAVKFRGVIEGICKVTSPEVLVYLLDSHPTIGYGGEPVICPGDNFLMYAAFDGVGSETCAFQWQISDVGPGGPFVNISGGENGQFNTGALSATRWYRVKPVCPGNGCAQSISPVQEVTVSVPDLSASCPPNITVSTGNFSGDCGAEVNYTTPSQPGNCGSISVTQTAGLASGSLFPVGVTTNTFQAVDGSGNTSTCSFTVSVTDSKSVQIFCATQIFTVYVPDNSSNCSIDEADILAQNLQAIAYSDCGSPPVSGPYPAGPYEVGEQEITWTVEDENGAVIESCSHTIKVEDQVRPIITCPGDITVDNDPGTCGAIVTYEVTATDNCEVQYIEQRNGLASGSFFPVGSTLNGFDAYDVNGNRAYCAFRVLVQDTEAPTFSSCPSDFTVNIDSETGQCGAGANVTYEVTPTDNCSFLSFVKSYGIDSGGFFPLGETPIRYYVYGVTSEGGVFVYCNFTVTVEDCILPPVAACKDITVSADANCMGTALASDFDDGSTDTSGNGLTFSVSPVGPYSLGTTNVTLTVSNPTGASSTCTATITVLDNTPPTINCPANIARNNDPGQCSAVVSYNAPTGMDNCPHQSTAQTAG